jgi:preprotein translocase SecE subunit
MNKVNWPSRDELKGLTQVVLVTLVVLGAIIGVYDIIFLQVMGWILELG